MIGFGVGDVRFTNSLTYIWNHLEGKLRPQTPMQRTILDLFACYISFLSFFFGQQHQHSTFVCYKFVGPQQRTIKTSY